TGLAARPRALTRIDIPVEEIVEVHAAHVERRHGEANERDVNDVCCGVGYCGRGDDIGPHGWQIGHPAQPPPSLGTGCSTCTPGQASEESGHWVLGGRQHSSHKFLLAERDLTSDVGRLRASSKIDRITSHSIGLYLM